MYRSSINTDSDSIDFDFFETEGDKIKMYDKTKQGTCSKIITKAVIETKPAKLFDFTKITGFTAETPPISNENWQNEKYQCTQIFDHLPSPTSSLEKQLIIDAGLESSLLNCLAYNDDSLIGKQNLNSTFLDDKYLSDNSLSDSTVTTVTSDFTSVSRLSSISDSSCTSDLCVDSLTSQNEDKDSSDTPNSFENVDSENVKEAEIDSEIVKEAEIDTGLPETTESEHSGNSNTSNREDKSDSEEQTSESEEENQNCSIGALYYPDDFDNEKDNVDDGSDIDNEIEDTKESESKSLSRKESIDTIEVELGDISLASQSTSSMKSSSLRNQLFRSSSKMRSKRKEYNLTFTREQLIKIERDNLTLLKKIMAYSKPRTVSINHSFSHKRTSAAINRARQQKKIEQDNYILYSKISAMSRMKKVF